MAPELATQQRRGSESDNSRCSTELKFLEQEDGQSGHPKASCLSCSRGPAEPQIREVRPSSAPVPWDPAVQLGIPASGPDYLDPPQSSAASRSSVVNDLGNAKYLADTRTTSHATSNRDSQALTEELVIHSGAGLTIDSVEVPVLRDTDLSSQGDVTPQDIVNGSCWEDEGAHKKPLGESIRAAIQVSQTREKRKFLPNDALDRIVTKERVRNELRNHNLGPPAQLDTLADAIWEVTEPRGKETTRRKIFAILGLIEQCEDIVDFIEGGLYDSDLPFILSDKGHEGRPQLCRKGKNGKHEPIKFRNKWKIPVHESFENNQWQLLAPYFQLLTESDRKVRHYPLANQITLPFIEDDEVKPGAGHEGGFGDVWRVKIHSAHHNCCKDSAHPHENPSYAVKRLRHDNPEAFDAEVSNLKRFSARDHVHLIKLLVTFQWRDQFYLLFPWADGNLLAFWKSLHSKPSSPKRDQNLAVWFSKQCLGIAQGLQMIHTADIPSESSPDDLCNDGLQIHGRHGDLKPENILWFKSYGVIDPSDFGVLKISDFGLTRFHRTLSKSHFESVAVSPTYRPPEYDIAMMVSQGFDIWSLGCVLLEFVTWYFLGGTGVERFSKERAKDDTREMRQDVFFNFVHIKEKNGELGARAKRSVYNEFQTLYKQKHCSDFFLDLLTFIKERLLRVSPDNRAKCEEIVKRFEELHNACKNDQDYCTTLTKKIPERSGTGLSEISASTVRLSKKKVDQINRHNLPEHTGPLEEENSPPKSPSFSTNSDTMNGYAPTRSVSPEAVQPELKRRTPEGMYAVPEGRTSLPINPSGLPSNDETRNASLDLNNTEKPNSRPQSPNKKVHFEMQQQKGWVRPSEPGNRFGTVREEGDTRQYHPIPPNTGGLLITLPDLPVPALPPPGQKSPKDPVVSVNGFGSNPALDQLGSPVHAKTPGMDEALSGDNVVENGGIPLPNSRLSDFQPENGHKFDTEGGGNTNANTETGEDGSPSGTMTGPLEPRAPQRQANSVNGVMTGKPVHADDGASGKKSTKKSNSKGVKRFLSSLFRGVRSKSRKNRSGVK
ncbi:kinase-like domain-containing protein [Halenospora varia]|nr:kinase-like domain-containing protein [Halenospora varia]